MAIATTILPQSRHGHDVGTSHEILSARGMPSSEDSSAPLNIAQALAPAEGERRAMRGYVGQYERAGAAIYAELERGQLLWIGVADRSAGIVDDLVLGFDGLVVGHQFKTAKFPGTFKVETLFTGANGLLKPLVNAWRSLRKADPSSRVEIRLVVNDYPSINDKPGDAAPAHSAAFLDEFERFPDRSQQEWRASSWSRLIEQLRQASGLDDDDFERFLHALGVLHGAAADFAQFHKLSTEQARLAAEIGVPTVALFGPTSPATWRPLGADVTVLAPSAPSPMTWLAVDQAIEAVAAILSRPV